MNSKPLAFRAGLDIFTSSEYFGYSLMYHRETIDCLGEDKGFNTFGFGAILRIPVKMGNFGLNPYGKLNGNFGIGDSRVLLGYTAEAGVQAMFNTESSVHFGLGVGYKQVHLSPWMDFNKDDDLKTRKKIDSFTNRGISIYGILSF